METKINNKLAKFFLFAYPGYEIIDMNFLIIKQRFAWLNAAFVEVKSLIVSTKALTHICASCKEFYNNTS